MKLRNLLVGCICLLIPLALHADPERIKWNKQNECGDRDLNHVIPLEAFWEDEQKVLRLEFWGNGNPITIEVTDEMGHLVYSGTCAVYAGGSFQLPLTDIPEEEYTLSVSDGKQVLTGEFSY